MHIQIVPNRGSPPAVLMRESYREDGKVKKRTLANLSSLPAEQIEAIRAVLRGDRLPRRQRLGHLRFEQFLQQISDNLAELVAVAAHQVFCRRNR
jgi:hypothetical protein